MDDEFTKGRWETIETLERLGYRVFETVVTPREPVALLYGEKDGKLLSLYEIINSVVGATIA